MSQITPSPRPQVTILVPAYNELENIVPLIEAFDRLRQEWPVPFEVLLVDDGSTDGTHTLAESVRAEHPWFRVTGYPRNRGKSAAITHGTPLCRGEYVCIFDADLQFGVDEVPKLYDKAREDKLDLVCGWKHGNYEKRFVSGIYNWLSRKLFGLKIHDLNAVKLCRREVLETVLLRKDWHRYLAVLAQEAKFRVGELPVTLHPRQFGEAKYSSPLRVFIGFFDMIAVKFLLTFNKKPLLLFGVAASISIGLGVLIGLVGLGLRVFLHFGYRPILYLVMLLILLGTMLFVLGFLLESTAHLADRITLLEQRLTRNAQRRKTRRKP